jgi:hypothetical protein
MLASNKGIRKDAPTKTGGFELQKRTVNYERVSAQLPSLSLFTFHLSLITSHCEAAFVVKGSYASSI